MPKRVCDGAGGQPVGGPRPVASLAASLPTIHRTSFRITGTGICNAEYLFPFSCPLARREWIPLGSDGGVAGPPRRVQGNPPGRRHAIEKESCKQMFTSRCKGGIMGKEGS